MLIVLLDEPGLFVYASAAEAARDIEPIDAESEIRGAFDDLGIPYRVEWVRPNLRRKSFFGLFASIEPGEYRLVPAGAAAPDALEELIESHLAYTYPAENKAALEGILAKLRAA